MTYNRIYENIYSFQVTSGVLNAGFKYYFDPMPELNNRKLKGISISNYQNLLNPSQLLYSFYITLINKKGDIINYNYPVVDLLDASWPSSYPEYRLRLFNFDDLDLKKSYYFFQAPVSFPPYNNLFKFNFYLD
jgi:hypothetical protein